MTPATVERLRIIIRGVSQRTASAVDSLVEELKTSGMSDAGIIARVNAEIETGKILSEMRNFATVRVPGVLADSVFRFARDTLSDKQKLLDRFKKIEATIATQNGEKPTPEQTAAAREIFDAENIDTTSWFEQPEMQPPPDADMEELYMWVAVEDKNTCSVCAGNHGAVDTLKRWAEIGEPRSGACLGDENCRCILVPVDSVTPEQQRSLADAGPIAL